jgi:hypothetical protein
MIIFLLGFKVTCPSAVSCVFDASTGTGTLLTCPNVEVTFHQGDPVRGDATQAWDWF